MQTIMDQHQALPKLVAVVGARPNFMKIAPIYKELLKYNEYFRVYLVHTGQHYDAAMKDTFFDQLGIPVPDIDLGVGSGTHAVQTGQIMVKFEPIIDELSPKVILVVGDVNSTIACSLVAAKKGIPVIHVEAGLRSFDRSMPEEINRILTDQLSDTLFTTERTARSNLLREGIDDDKIRFVGNVMIDSLRSHVARSIPAKTTVQNFRPELSASIEDKRYCLLTLHRPSNVDDQAVLSRLLNTIVSIADILPVIFPVHPRTRKMISSYGLERFFNCKNIIDIQPLGYLEMLGLMNSAKFVLTDSGGIQEETTALGIPCVTIRENTERPITVEEGTNTVVGTEPSEILSCVDSILETGGKTGKLPELWDGQASCRMVEIIKEKYFDKR